MWETLAELANFETERLLLRPFYFTDAPDLFTILSNPQNTAFIYPPVSSVEACQTLLVEAFMRHPLGIWALESRETGQMIGAIRLENIQERQKCSEIGYFLNQDYWKKGLMTEALTCLVFLAFSRLKLKKLMIRTHEENIASQRLAERAGFTYQRRYKGSDRYSHKIRYYRDYHYLYKNYYPKELYADKKITKRN